MLNFNICIVFICFSQKRLVFLVLQRSVNLTKIEYLMNKDKYHLSEICIYVLLVTTYNNIFKRFF